jgi:hypothetical protein
VVQFESGLEKSGQVAGFSGWVKDDDEMVEEPLHPKQSGGGKTLFEASHNRHRAAGDVERYVVKVCITTAADALGLLGTS